MKIKKVASKSRSSIKASTRAIRSRRAIKAGEEFEDEMIDEAPVVDDVEDEVEDVEIAPEATELLFEVEDVAELVAEVTGEDVTVDADENVVEFTIGGDEVYTVEPDDDAELVESAKACRKPVKASRRVAKRSIRKTSRR